MALFLRGKPMKKPTKKLAVIAILLTQFSCKGSKDSLLDVVGGKYSPDSKPGVVYLASYFQDSPQKVMKCTGSIINDSQVLTAGHCIIPSPSGGGQTLKVDIFRELGKPLTQEEFKNIDESNFHKKSVTMSSDSDDGKVQFFQTIASSTEIHLHPAYDAIKQKEISHMYKKSRSPELKQKFYEIFRYDIAIIDFPPNTFKVNHIPLDLTPSAKVGDPVKLIGYGSIHPKNITKVGFKRLGSNTINEVDSYFVTIRGKTSHDASGELVTAGTVDSGSPLIKDGKIIGVLSHGRPKDQNASVYVKTDSPSVADFLRSTLKTNADSATFP